MILRNYLGLDIDGNEIRVVSLRKKKDRSLLLGTGAVGIDEGVYVPSVRDPNIRDLKTMADKLREVLLPLSGREERISVSLPDASGRVVLTEMDTPISSHREGEQVVRWHLKKNLGLDLKQLHLDYRILSRTESGQRVIVALTSQTVIQQIEDLLENLGFFAKVINFHSLCLFNYYASRVRWENESLLLGIEEGVFTLHYLQHGSVIYHHARPLKKPTDCVPEVIRIFAGCGREFPSSENAKIFLHCGLKGSGELLSDIESVLGREIALLDSNDFDLRENCGNPFLSPLLPAIGAAERMMR